MLKTSLIKSMLKKGVIVTLLLLQTILFLCLTQNYWQVHGGDVGRLSVVSAREVVDENGVILYHANLEPGLNGFWVEAKDLRVGDVFLGANGELSTLTGVLRVEQDGGIAVFNFSVDGNHNYFIIARDDEYGQTCILVHNADPRCGIYEFADQRHPGKDYVGQSVDIDARIAQHQATGKAPDISQVTVTEMPGADKLAREIAEHTRIQELTKGVPARLSDAVSNQRDPIGPARIHLIQ